MLKNIIIVATFILSIIALTLILVKEDYKMCYIDMGKVYEEFKLTRELNRDYEVVAKTQKKIQDSLYNILELKASSYKKEQDKDGKQLEELKVMESNFLNKKDMFEKQGSETMNEYNNKIWKQINQFVADYGKNENYTIIFGANGQGNVMYGDKLIDKTDDIILFINNKYDGN